MSFTGYKKFIEEGDTVIMYFHREVINSVVIKNGATYNCRFGSYKHDDMIGKQYGLKLASCAGKGFAYLLHPTPELWTQVVPHRTQILYMTDIAFISSYLDLKPGVKMIESGTGSGSFSHSIARTIGPTGHLYTFEYHKERVEAAKKEFLEHKLEDIITVTHRDACKEGFGLENEVQAVFLDLPSPWEAIASAKLAIKKSTIGSICSFSPCIEQVQRSCLALAENGFTEIKTFECLTKGFEYKMYPVISLDEAMDKLKSKSLKRKLSGTEKDEDSTKKDDDSTQVEGSISEQDEESDDTSHMAMSKPFAEMRGHTSYLTFAVLAPIIEESNE